MKRTLITGANRGVGLALAQECARRGERVFAGCRSPQRAQALEDLSNTYPGRVSILPLDIADEASIRRCAATVRAETEALDCLVNNAAAIASGENIRTFQPEQALDLLQVNAVGQVIVAQGFLDLLKAGEAPRIVNISSEAGSISQMNSYRGYYYYASKAALNMYSRAMAWDPELAGVIVIALHPGWVRTDMGGQAAPLLADESAKGILQVVDGLTAADNGKFFTWQGEEYPW